MIEDTKYRISNLAKDLNMKSKELIELLAECGVEGKTHMGLIEPDEFDYIMNLLSTQKQIKNIDSYLNGETKIRLKKETPPKGEAQKSDAKDQASQKDIKPQQPQQQQKVEKEVKKEEPPKKEEKQEKKQMDTAAQNQTANKVAQEKKTEAKVSLDLSKLDRFKTPSFGNQNQKVQKPQPKQPEKKPEPKQPPIQIKKQDASQPLVLTDEKHQKAHIGGTRVIDTRTTTVDLSKYDERLEKFILDSDKTLDIVSEKQKLSKKQNFKGKGEKDKEKDKEKAALEKLRKKEAEKKKAAPPKITVPDEITVSELASRMKVTAASVVKQLMMMGVMASVNQVIDFDTAYLVADEMGIKVEKEVVVTIEDRLFDDSVDTEDMLSERPPVVCVMGHVDHGKTSLLDAIRNTNVTAGEAGGITQHIGAYRVNVKGKSITFLDTPGHEAFTAMRARGAQATDIAILVVAGDDGIMPQTVEAINHAKAAGVDIIVAINKMDKPTFNADNVKQELTKYELVPEEWGGDVICVNVSALTKQGIDDLLENVLILAEMKELKANPNRKAKGIIIEAKLDKGRGPVATVLVQNGTLHTGDVVIAGTAVGRVRAMNDENRHPVKEAGPSVPVEIVGLSEVPNAGDEFAAVDDERMARELAEQRKEKQKEKAFKASSRVNLDELFSQINEGIKDLNVIVKADVDGSAEAVKAALEKISNEEVRVKVIHSAVGGITEGDVMLASASNAIIVGFNVRPDRNAMDAAERQGVDIRTYKIIYECIEEITAAIKGMLSPEFKENVIGHVEVRQTIKVPNAGMIAGSYVLNGKVARNSLIRVIRDGVIIFEDKIASLRRFKDDVKEVAQGYECGIGLEKFNDIKVGDILEAYEMVEVKK